MFKKLGSAITRRGRVYTKLESLHAETTDAVALFLKEKFGDASGVVSYHFKGDALWIQTANKVVASELTMHLPEFSEFLRTRSIIISKIIIQ